ncbi:MAG TPA: response regulator [Mycobacteriales bacterium]|nr:response regulator [Mycobacteriales bacterium]HWA66139.1 response regulator [Mycobacteriales bacterium]
MTATQILVVEDDPSVRGLLESLLQGEGYAVTTASDGIGGLVKVAANRPALVLLDVMMPDLGGIRVLEELQADPATADLPVLIVTGKLDAVPALAAMIGADNVIPKPFAVAQLLARIAEVTGGPVTRPEVK